MHTRIPVTTTIAVLMLAACGPTSTDHPAGPAPSGTTAASSATASASAPSTDAAGAADPTETASASPTPTAAGPLSLTTNVADGARAVPVDTLLTVTPTNGQLTTVTVDSTASGKNAATISGQVDRQGVWTADGRLDPDARYTITATAKGPDGTTKTTTTSFTTASLSRQQEVFPTLTPVQGGPFGVGQPLVIQFDLPVANKAEFEKNLRVTSVPAQEGSWGWLDDKTVHYRPRTWWKPGTKVTLDAHLNGVNAGQGRYGQLNRTLELLIGRDQHGTVDIAKHTISWTRDGKTVGTWPMTAGKPGFVTRSGTKVVMEKAEGIEMASETTGIARDSAEGYNVKVDLALRVTSSGEFIHSAPWNEGNFGVRNASHGCVGMADDTMYALYETAQIGDPVVFKGSDRKLEPGNGWTAWDVSWEQWKQKSALA